MFASHYYNYYPASWVGLVNFKTFYGNFIWILSTWLTLKYIRHKDKRKTLTVNSGDCRWQNETNVRICVCFSRMHQQSMQEKNKRLVHTNSVSSQTDSEASSDASLQRSVSVCIPEETVPLNSGQSNWWRQFRRAKLRAARSDGIAWVLSLNRNWLVLRELFGLLSRWVPFSRSSVWQRSKYIYTFPSLRIQCMYMYTSHVQCTYMYVYVRLSIYTSVLHFTSFYFFMTLILSPNVLKDHKMSTELRALRLSI